MTVTTNISITYFTSYDCSVKVDDFIYNEVTVLN